MTATIDQALTRLDQAMVRLEGAVTRRLEAEQDFDARDAELGLMGEDRSRLAAALDAASARLQGYEGAAGLLGARIDRAIGAVEDALGPSVRSDTENGPIDTGANDLHGQEARGSRA